MKRCLFRFRFYPIYSSNQTSIIDRNLPHFAYDDDDHHHHLTDTSKAKDKERKQNICIGQEIDIINYTKTLNDHNIIPFK